MKKFVALSLTIFAMFMPVLCLAAAGSITFTGSIAATQASNQYATVSVNKASGTYDVYSTVTGRKLASFSTAQAANAYALQVDAQDASGSYAAL